MSDNANKGNNAHKWFPLLLAVLTLLAIITNIDNTPANGGSGSGNSGDVGGNTNISINSNTNSNVNNNANNNSGGNTDTQQNVSQSKPSNTVLSAVPSELRNNYFLERKEMGCCKTLSGKVAVTVVMISDSVGQWDAESTTNLKNALEVNGQDIVAEANAHQVELSFSFHYYNAKMTGDICGGERTNDWQDPALQRAGLPALANLHNYLTKKYSSKEAPVVFVFNKPGRAFASSIGNNEYFVLYARNNFDAFQHELSHVFGAKDFYYPKEVKTLATAAFPDSIMSTGETADPLTAYLIGWTDTVSDSALQFLKDTNTLPAEYMNAKREEQSITGYGTMEFDSGTYTGDLIRGERHGTGTMRYDNGSWYTGGWSYGSWSGSGTGKWTYKDGGIYEGSFLNNNRHGKGTFYYPDGAVYTGDWVEGKKQGTGTMRYSNGSEYTGGWNNDQRSGTGRGKEIYSNGVYEGEFLDGKRHGQGTYTFENGSVYKGGWSNGEQSGDATGKLYYENGFYEGQLYNGKRHGQGTYTYYNGSVYKGGWSNGEKSGNGSGKMYYDNGVYEGQFYNGQRHGQGTYTWSDGNCYTGQWKDGKRTGYGTYTWPNGNSKTGNWQDGKFVG